MLTPPENFQTHPKNLDPSRRNTNNPPKNFNLPNMHFSIPPPENMLTITPPPIHFSSFYLFFFTFQKNIKIPGGGWGVKPHEIRPCVLSINKNVFLKILNSPSKICEARDNIIIYRSEQRPLTYFLLRILYKKKVFSEIIENIRN